MKMRNLLWVLLPLAVLSLFAFLRLGNGFIERDGRVHLVHDGSGYHFVRNGQAYFVKGAAGPSHLTTLQESGGNTIRIYHPDSLANALDQADSLGLAVIADLPLPTYYAGEGFYGVKPAMDSIIAATRNVIVKHREHPALLCWILGNEINFNNTDKVFQDDYRRLLDTVRRYDPDHPIGTTVVMHQMIGIHLSPRKSGLDFLGINIFGSITSFETNKALLSMAWTGPYLITEWGNGGPWEAKYNNWGAPIEPSSYYKAQQLRERYTKYLEGISDGRLLGHLVFYWGQKQERTPTWFSFFSPDGLKTQNVHELENLWKSKDNKFAGTEIDYLLMDGQGAGNSPVFKPGDTTVVTASYQQLPDAQTRIHWAITPETWYNQDTSSVGVDLSDELVLESSADRAQILLPTQPGPYRVMLYAADTSGYVATANLPFFVMAIPDEN